MFAGVPEVVLEQRWNNVAKRIGARGSMDGVDENQEPVRRAFASKSTAQWSEFLANQPEIIWERCRTTTSSSATRSPANG